MEDGKEKRGGVVLNDLSQINDVVAVNNEPSLPVILARQQDPIHLVSEFMKKQPVYYDKNKLWWVWKNNRWVLTTDVDIINLIRESYDIVGLLSSNFKNALVDAFKLEGRRLNPKEPPVNWIQFGKIVYDINTDSVFAPSPNYFFTNVLPYEPSDDSETPFLDKLFEGWVGKDYVKTLYQIIAYSVYSDYPIHRMFVFFGRGRNGKGTFFNVLNKFLGVDNITSTELDLLVSNRFESAKLYRKLVAQMSETNTSRLSATSLLKKLTGNDLIGFEFKNKDPFDAKSYAKIMISTNTLPETPDKTDGFYRRMLIIDFPNQFSEKRDVLSEIPEREFHNLSRKIIGILKELLSVREFHNEGSVEDRARRYEEYSNPLDSFLSEMTVEDFDSFIPKFDFRDRFWSWCKQRGFRKYSEAEIGVSMKKRFHESRRTFDDGKRWRVWDGLRWKDETDRKVVSDTLRQFVNNNHDNKESDDKIIEESVDLSFYGRPVESDEEFVSMVSSLDDGEGVRTDILLVNSGLSEDVFFARLNSLREKGLLFEPVNGRWKVL